VRSIVGCLYRYSSLRIRREYNGGATQRSRCFAEGVRRVLRRSVRRAGEKEDASMSRGELKGRMRGEIGYGSPMEQFELVSRYPVRDSERRGVEQVVGRRRRGRGFEGRAEYGRGSEGGRVEGRGKGLGKRSQASVMMGVGVLARKMPWGRDRESGVLPSSRTSRSEGREVGRVDRRRQTMGESGEAMVGRLKAFMEAVRRRNRRGMVPYTYSMTAQLRVTARRARSVWIWKRWRGVEKHGRKLLGRRRPTGTPLGMVPMMVGLECRGFAITSVSLSVRLFANRMAGHILLKVLGGFGWVMRLGTERRGRRPLGVVRRLILLETAVACIQAYVFVLLRCIYIGDMRKGGH
jgi:F-type H+-transporting ATPase subunit a